MIQNHLIENFNLNSAYIPLYESFEGRQVYQETLESCRTNFPQYIRELEGLAEGAEVEFYKVRIID